MSTIPIGGDDELAGADAMTNWSSYAVALVYVGAFMILCNMIFLDSVRQTNGLLISLHVYVLAIIVELWRRP